MEVAKIQVGGTCACAYEKKTIRAGMVGVTVSFAFDEYWDGLNKIAVYRCGGVVRDEYLEGDTGTVPAEVLTKSGFDLEIGVYGTDAEKQIAIPTCWANLGVVRPGADPSGDPAADPELPFWAKVQEWLKTRFVKTVNGIGADENGNVEIETGKVDVDPTLTVEGQAADAKAVGDALGKSSWKIYEGTFSGYSYSVNNYNTGNFVPGKFEQFYKEPITIVLDGISYFVENTNPGLDSNGYAICEYGDSSLSKYPFYVKVGIAFANIYEYTISVNTDGEHTFAMYRHVIDIVDSTLKYSGLAADAKVVSDALDTKAPKVMTVYIDGNYNSGWTSNYTSQEIYNHINSGGIAVCRASAHSALVLSSVDTRPGYVEFYGREPIGLYYYNAEKYYRIVIKGSSATLESYDFYPYTIDRIDTSEGNPVSSRAVRDYAVPIPATAEVGQVLSVKAVDGNGKPTKWEPVGMPKAVTIDPTLSIEGQAADAKAVGDALADKAKKPLIINADDAPTTGSNSVSGIPIFTIDYSPADLKAYADAGGSVTIVRYNRHYEMYDATEETAKFRFIEATDTQVDWYHAVLDANKNMTITKTTHKSRMETTTGGAVGQIPIIKSLDSKGCPSTWEFGDIPKAVAVPDAVGATPTAEEFNALLTALRNAGLMAAE